MINLALPEDAARERQLREMKEQAAAQAMTHLAIGIYRELAVGQIRDDVSRERPLNVSKLNDYASCAAHAAAPIMRVLGVLEGPPPGVEPGTPGLQNQCSAD